MYTRAIQVAVERAVEWGGNIDVLSPDSRFAIANMSVEFGGIAGVHRIRKRCYLWRSF